MLRITKVVGPTFPRPDEFYSVGSFKGHSEMIDYLPQKKNGNYVT